MNKDFLYHYQAANFRVYDGDTVRCDIDLGLGIWMHNQTLRLYGIEAPELRGEERSDGLASKQWLRERVEGKTLTIRTYKDKTGKYGRWLAVIYDEQGRDLNEMMIEAGTAREYQ